MFYFTLDILPDGSYKTKDFIVEALDGQFGDLLEFIRKRELEDYQSKGET